MNSKAKWSVTQAIDKAHLTQVFSGGACNILDANGNLLRNKERDRINDWLTEQGIIFFDPQIHPATHGEEYDYDRHFPLERAAREAAYVNLYEVSPRTFGGITSLEIAMDLFYMREPMVIYFSDGDETTDTVPAHSERGQPLFQPYGIEKNRKARRAHYREFVKNGNRMRRYLMTFARTLSTLTVTFGPPVADTDVVISPNRLHATDIFRAMVRAASGEQIMVTFTGGQSARDEHGNPRFIVPDEPREIELSALLDQYVDEGNSLRAAISKMVEVSIYVRITYTTESTLLALKEVLQLKGLI